MPVESAKISAMPMIPMLPAKEVIKVRPFLVRRLLKDSDSAVNMDMEGLRSRFFLPSCSGLAFFSSSVAS